MSVDSSLRSEEVSDETMNMLRGGMVLSMRNDTCNLAKYPDPAGRPLTRTRTDATSRHVAFVLGGSSWESCVFPSTAGGIGS